MPAKLPHNEKPKGYLLIESVVAITLLVIGFLGCYLYYPIQLR